MKRIPIPLFAALLVPLATAPAWAAPKEKQTQNPAIVFLVAGQSNAGGCGVYSPEIHKERGLDQVRPLVPGSTAVEVGLSTNAADYTHSYIWMPKSGFERLDPMTNTRPTKPGIKNHGIELPVVNRLEKMFPDNDIYVIKYGPNGKSLHKDWNPENRQNRQSCYARWIDWYSQAMAVLTREYPDVRVIGLYWDQGESDPRDTEQYSANLRNLIATFRKDSGITNLKFYLRKHLYNSMETIIAAQQAVAGEDPNVHLLDIDLGSHEENDKAWSYSPNNIHISSKAFVELARLLFEQVLKEPVITSFDPAPRG